MEPLPATAEVLRLLADLGDADLATRVDWICGTILDLVPHADALAIWFSDEDLTLAFVEHEGQPSDVRPAKRSSLSLRVATPTRLIAVVNVYSQHLDAFAGHASALERSLGAVAGSAMRDVDLAFDAQRRAGSAPAQMRAGLLADTAIGLLMGTQGFTLDEAEHWLDHVAATSGRTHVDVARQVVAAHRPSDRDNAPLGRTKGTPSMPPTYALCRIAYMATDHDPTTRDRRLKDFPAETMAIAEGNARRWATDRNKQRTEADRATWPWVLERWDNTSRSWELVTHLR